MCGGAWWFQLYQEDSGQDETGPDGGAGGKDFALKNPGDDPGDNGLQR